MPKPQSMQPRAAGRVLSARNEKRLIDARDQLDAVLSELQREMEEDSGFPLQSGRLALKPGSVRINAADDDGEAEILIYGDIGGGWFGEGITGESVRKEIKALDAEVINVRINSVGGLVFEGVAIYNALAQHSAKIIVHIDGIAASIASIIAMAGDEIRIAEGAHIMIHKPWSFVMGDAESLRKEAEILDKLETGLIDIYAARTGNSRDDLETWVKSETWFLGQEAVDNGFADVMVPAKKKKKAATSGLFNFFRNTPTNLLEKSESPDIRDFETFLREGEGLSHAQAKRIAIQAMSGCARDEQPKPQEKPLRDVGGLAAGAVKQSDTCTELAARISQFTTNFKE